MVGLAAGQGDNPQANPGAGLFPVQSRVQFAAIAVMRWRLLVNSLRRKGGKGELAARLITWPLLLLVVCLPVVAAGLGAYFFILEGNLPLLTLSFWGVFLYGQLIGVNIAARPPAFDLNALIRFPIRYVDYVLLRVWFELLTFQTISTALCLLAMLIGIAVAQIELVPWAALVLLAFALMNIFFSRMMYAWFERWLAQRKTRELLGGLVIVISLGAQLIGPTLRYFDDGKHAVQYGLIQEILKGLNRVSEVLPPGLAADSIVELNAGRLSLAAVLLAAILGYALVFFVLYAKRLRAQFLGEELGETRISPSSRGAKAIRVRAARAAEDGGRRHWISPVIAACVEKELRYLMRSGPMLLNLITPVFMIVVFSAQGAGRGRGGLYQWHGMDFSFFWGAAYTLLLVVPMLYNSFGADGTGVQLYMLAPQRLRSAVLAKNLVSVGVMAGELMLVWVAVALMKGPPSAGLTAAVLAWAAAAVLPNLMLGNVRSLKAPKQYEIGKMRRQRASGVSGILSMLLVVGGAIAGAGVVYLCLRANMLWLATVIFVVVAALELAGYFAVLNRVDGILAERREWIAEELCKTA